MPDIRKLAGKLTGHFARCLRRAGLAYRPGRVSRAIPRRSKSGGFNGNKNRLSTGRCTPVSLNRPEPGSSLRSSFVDVLARSAVSGTILLAAMLRRSVGRLNREATGPAQAAQRTEKPVPPKPCAGGADRPGTRRGRPARDRSRTEYQVDAKGLTMSSAKRLCASLISNDEPRRLPRARKMLAALRPAG